MQDDFEIAKIPPIFASHSPEMKEIWAAVVDAQAEYTPVPKNKTATVKGRSKTGSEYEYEYKYADLADVLGMALPVLTKHGLALLQPHVLVEGKLRVCTLLVHRSGQWLLSYGLALPENLMPQEFGSLSTYWRRYDGSTTLGIAADEDVDAQGGTNPRKPVAPRPAVRQPAATSSEPVQPLSAGEQILTKRDELVEKLTALIPNRRELGHRAKLMFPEHQSTKTLTVVDLQQLYAVLAKEQAEKADQSEPAKNDVPAPSPDSGLPNDLPPDVVAMFDEGKLTTAARVSGPKIGKGLAQRLHKLIGIHKLHTEAELMENYLKPAGVEHVSDLPRDLYEPLCAWAEGKLLEGVSGAQEEPGANG
jgi:hypothetical protein